MPDHVCLDSNALTQLVEAMQPGYDPGADEPHLAEQRIAMIRIFLYGGTVFHLVPTVAAEYEAIPDERKRAVHARIGSILLIDGPWELDRNKIATRAAALETRHSGLNDRLIIAEAEELRMTHLLTCDTKLARNLDDVVALVVEEPRTYLERLGIKRGARPVFSPHPTNPLAQQKWWRYEHEAVGT